MGTEDPLVTLWATPIITGLILTWLLIRCATDDDDEWPDAPTAVTTAL